MAAGASPKVITSARESSSTPMGDETFNLRAANPSKKSNMAPAIMKHNAVPYLSAKANLTAMQPQVRLHSVIMFGMCFFIKLCDRGYGGTSLLVLGNLVWERLECGQHGAVAYGGLTENYLDVCVGGQKDVDTAAKFDEAEVFVNVALFVAACVGDDAASHGAGNLPDEDFAIPLGVDYYGGSLVFEACLGQPCFMEIAVLVFYFLDDAVYGKPIGMDVGQGHENGDHFAFVVEVLLLVNFFNHNYFAVGRSNHHSFCLAFEVANGATEEVDHDAVDYCRDGENDIENAGKIEHVDKNPQA